MADSDADAHTERVDGRVVERGVGSRNAQIVRASIVGIVANLLLAGFKAVVGLGSHSIAIVLDAVNNLSDVASSAVTIVGTRLAGKAPDRRHPFGYGRVEYLTTVVVSVIVLWAGISSVVESVERIVSPVTPSYDALGLVIVAVAVGAKVALGVYVRGTGRRIGSGSLVASGTDALTDAVISAATLVAAGVYLLWGVSLEAWLGVVIAVLIVRAGLSMLSEVLSKIIGERVDPETAARVKASVASVPGVRGAYDLMLDDYGPDTLWGSVHVEVADDMTAHEIDELTRQIQTRVYQDCGVVIHTVGVYAQNAEGGVPAKIRSDIYDIAEANDYILEVHGFYVDEPDKAVRFDLVVSFDAPSRELVVSRIRHILERRYPGYSFEIALDSDISTDARE